MCGSYDGRVYWSARAENGSLGKPRAALHEDGSVLMAGKYWDAIRGRWTGTDRSGDDEAHGTAVAVVDWDEDGDTDLVLGCQDGRIFLRENVGSEKGPRFTVDNVKIKHGRRSLWVRSGGATPVAADWNGDGLFDLLSGTKQGGAYVWLNVGKPGEPEFSAPVQLLAEVAKGAEPAEDAPGLRTQVHVADYDGDGLVDLLVGDYRRVDGKPHGWVWLLRRESVARDSAD